MQYVRMSQLTLSVLSLIFALVVLGTSSHVLSTFHTQSSANNPWWLPLWPQHFDTANTKVFIGVAASLMLLNIFYLVVSFLPRLSLSSSPVLGALTTISIALPSILLALTAIIVDVKVNRAGSTDSIKAWTCRFRDVEQDSPTSMKLPITLTNAHFSTICSEATFNLWGAVILLILETLLLFSAVAQFFQRKPAAVYTHEEKSTSDINMSTPTKAFDQ